MEDQDEEDDIEMMPTSAAADGKDGKEAKRESKGDSKSDGPGPMAGILQSVIGQFMSKGSVLSRSAGCTWLLCLVKFAGSHSAVQAALSSIQAAFSAALTEADQFTQECAAKGMALVYQVGDASMRQQLVGSLVRTFAVGKRDITADTQITTNGAAAAACCALRVSLAYVWLPPP